MSQLEQAAKAVAEVFYKYAGQDAKKNKLSTEELKALLQKEVTSLGDTTAVNFEKRAGVENMLHCIQGQLGRVWVSHCSGFMLVYNSRALCLENKVHWSEPGHDISVIFHYGMLKCAAAMSQLESAVQSLVDVFIKYAEQEGSKNQLSQGELKRLITTELSSGALGKMVGPEEVGELMGQLDKNHDGEVNMQEFCRFIGILAKGYYKSKKKGSP
ncbi:UNVERIFIED_CONTAM: hypothetical protein FKN15_010913 [Acipenser sinensis]